MADLRLKIDENGRADLELEDGDLAVDSSGLEQAFLACLFTDARADDDDEIPDGTDDRRGYWADTEGDRWGSKAWLLSRAPATPQTARRLEIATREALQVLIDEQVIERLEVDAQVVGGTVCLEVEAERSAARRWSHVWDQVELAAFTAGSVSVRLLAS